MTCGFLIYKLIIFYKNNKSKHILCYIFKKSCGIIPIIQTIPENLEHKVVTGDKRGTLGKHGSVTKREEALKGRKKDGRGTLKISCASITISPAFPSAGDFPEPKNYFLNGLSQDRNMRNIQAKCPPVGTDQCIHTRCLYIPFSKLQTKSNRLHCLGLK